MNFYGEETNRNIWAGDGTCCICKAPAVARIWGEEGAYVCIEHLLADMTGGGVHLHSLIFDGKEYILNGYEGLDLLNRTITAL